jgi:hypothetical protein
MSELTKSTIESLFPKGEIWTPKSGGDFDLLLDGIADCMEDTVDFLRTVGEVRNPLTTGLLEDLEKEFGIKLPTVEESLRRQRLNARKYVKRRDGTLEQMQYFFEEAGFDGLFVYPNDPAIDPSSIGSFLLVNNLKQGDNNYYEIPADPIYWPNFVFIGGAATYGGGGEITAVAKADVDIRRFNELKNLIVGLKGMGIWVVLQINLIPASGDTGDEPFGFYGDPDARGWSDVDNPDIGGIYLGVGD